MCGRFYIRDITKAGGIREVAPSDSTLIMTGLTGEWKSVKWGYKGKQGQLIINARAESVKSRPMFGRDYLKRRCLVPASGFYEWDSEKLRYCVTDSESADEIYLAGIQTGLPDDDGRFAILTVPANEQLKALHPRMPVLIKKCEFDRWFGSFSEADRLVAEKIQGKQTFYIKRDLEINQINDTIEIYVQQNLMSYIDELNENQLCHREDKA